MPKLTIRGRAMMMATIRLVVTLTLIYGAAMETGIWTALCLLLIFAAIETQAYLWRVFIKAGKK